MRRDLRAVDLGGREVESDAAGPDEPAPEARAAELRRHVQEVSAQPPAVRRRREIGDVAGERAEVADVVREALELERDAADGVGVRGHHGAGERLDRLAVRQRVADRRVARGGLHVRQGPLRRPAHEGPLDAAMLVAERDLEVKDLLAVALEPEVPGLDHAGVDRADRDLVDLVPFDPEEISHSGRDPGVRRPAPRVVALAIRMMEPHRLQPRMSLEPDAVLLGDLALEEVRLRDLGHDRLERRSVRRRARDEQAPVRVVREHGRERDVRDGLVRRAEVGRDAPPLVPHALDEPLAEPRGREPRHVLQGQDAGVSRRGRDLRRSRHEAPSRDFAASRTRS